MLELPQGAGLGICQGPLKVLADIPDAGGFAQPDAVLEVEKQAAVIQVDGADGGKAVVQVIKPGVYSYICTPASSRGG